MNLNEMIISRECATVEIGENEVGNFIFCPFFVQKLLVRETS